MRLGGQERLSSICVDDGLGPRLVRSTDSSRTRRFPSPDQRRGGDEEDQPKSDQPRPDHRAGIRRRGGLGDRRRRPARLTLGQLTGGGVDVELHAARYGMPVLGDHAEREHVRARSQLWHPLNQGARRDLRAGPVGMDRPPEVSAVVTNSGETGWLKRSSTEDGDVGTASPSRGSLPSRPACAAACPVPRTSSTQLTASTPSHSADRRTVRIPAGTKASSDDFPRWRLRPGRGL